MYVHVYTFGASIHADHDSVSFCSSHDVAVVPCHYATGNFFNK